MKKYEYETAQVCLNGHVVTAYYESSPEARKKHCVRCGQSTIYECNECKAPIHGWYIQPNVSYLCPFDPPDFCHECGKPYPWTKAKIEAANEFVDDLDELSKDDKDKFKKSIDEIIKNSPRGNMAVNKIAKLIRKLDPVNNSGARKLLDDISGEALKKYIESQLGPNL